MTKREISRLFRQRHPERARLQTMLGNLKARGAAPGAIARCLRLLQDNQLSLCTVCGRGFRECDRKDSECRGVTMIQKKGKLISRSKAIQIAKDIGERAARLESVHVEYDDNADVQVQIADLEKRVAAIEEALRLECPEGLASW